MDGSCALGQDQRHCSCQPDDECANGPLLPPGNARRSRRSCSYQPCNLGLSVLCHGCGAGPETLQTQSPGECRGQQPSQTCMIQCWKLQSVGPIACGKDEMGAGQARFSHWDPRSPGG